MQKLDTKASASDLIALLERQQGLAERIDEIAARQSHLIESGRSEALLELLAARQEIIDEFLSSQDALGPVTGALRGTGIPEAQRSRIATLVESISDVLGRIVSRDERDRAGLKAGRDRLGQDLENLRAGRRARHAYVQGRAVNNRFANRQG